MNSNKFRFSKVNSQNSLLHVNFAPQKSTKQNTTSIFSPIVDETTETMNYIKVAFNNLNICNRGVNFTKTFNFQFYKHNKYYQYFLACC